MTITSAIISRLSRSVPLKTLTQGSTLSIRSKIPNVAVRIQSGWRDDGHATLEQRFGAASSGNSSKGTPSSSLSSSIVGMSITQEADQRTSLGRSESYLSIVLEPSTEDITTLPIPVSSSSNTKTDASNRIEFQDGDAWMTAYFDDNDVSPAAASATDRPVVTVQVPEKVNLICELDLGGTIQVDNKIEGDVKLMTNSSSSSQDGSGDIRVQKLRGHTVDLETQGNNDAVIYASDLLEAENLMVKMQGGRFRAKRIHGHAVDIQMSPSSDINGEQSHQSASAPLGDDDEGSLVDISSMYVSGAGGALVSLKGDLRPVKRGVRIKSHHGPALVHVSGVAKPTSAGGYQSTDDKVNGGDASALSSYPLVDLGSVNGSCEVSITNMPRTKENASSTDSSEWTACHVHYDSISAESVSLVTVESGNIGLTFDRKMEADLRLLSSPSLTDSSLEDVATMLAEEEDPGDVEAALKNLESGDTATTDQRQASRISIKTESYTESHAFLSSNNTLEYKEGWVENKSHEPDSRFEMKTRGNKAVGKINMEGAADQALKNFSSPSLHNDADASAGGSVDPTRPLIVAATTGAITVETLSWLGSIARRYGLDEKGRDLGRQASRRGRQIVPADE